MGKVDENKKQKREALLNTAYELFTTKGTNATAISDIVRQAGVAKGTFYLYFKDKYDIKNKLVAHKTSDLFQKAGRSMREAQVNGLENLVMGALRNTLLTGESDNSEIYDEFIKLVEEDDYSYDNVDVMLFTIVELAGSAGYNSILYQEPLPIEEYKTFLYRTVRLIIESHRITTKEEAVS